MKLIIDIPEDIYNHTQAYEIGGFNQENDARVFDLIKYGIPLDNDSERAEVQTYFDKSQEPYKTSTTYDEGVRFDVSLSNC